MQINFEKIIVEANIAHSQTMNDRFTSSVFYTCCRHYVENLLAGSLFPPISIAIFCYNTFLAGDSIHSC